MLLSDEAAGSELLAAPTSAGASKGPSVAAAGAAASAAASAASAAAAAAAAAAVVAAAMATTLCCMRALALGGDTLSCMPTYTSLAWLTAIAVSMAPTSWLSRCRSMAFGLSLHRVRVAWKY